MDNPKIINEVEYGLGLSDSLGNVALDIYDTFSLSRGIILKYLTTDNK